MFEIVKQQLIAQGAPIEVIEWVTKFYEQLGRDRPLKIFSGFVQMGVEPANKCDCDPEYGKTAPTSAWLHANHTLYNRAIWQLIAERPGMLEKLQRVLVRDLKTPDRKIGKCPDAFGLVVEKAYGQELLEYGAFTDKPNPMLVG